MAFYKKSNSLVTDMILEIAKYYLGTASFWQQHAARITSDECLEGPPPRSWQSQISNF